MTRPRIGVYVIGQTPRPDLTSAVGARFPGADVLVRGALDGVQPDALPSLSDDGFPLETTLTGGVRVEVDAHELEPLLQRALTELDGEVDAHLVLCAGPFPGLTAGRPLVRPFANAVEILTDRGVRDILAVVPFPGQEESARLKWRRAGFAVRTVVASLGAESDVGTDGEPGTGLEARIETLTEVVGEAARSTGAQAVVFDYVGVPPAVVSGVRAKLDIPLYDLGESALDAVRVLLAEQSEI